MLMGQIYSIDGYTVDFYSANHRLVQEIRNSSALAMEL